MSQRKLEFITFYEILADVSSRLLGGGPSSQGEVKTVSSIDDVHQVAAALGFGIG